MARKRNEIEKKYLKEITNSKIKLPKVIKNIYHSWHLFVIQVENRDEFRKYMQEQEIQIGIYYQIALLKLKAYKYLYLN